MIDEKILIQKIEEELEKIKITDKEKYGYIRKEMAYFERITLYFLEVLREFPKVNVINDGNESPLPISEESTRCLD